MSKPALPEKPKQHKHRILAGELRSLAASLQPGDRMPSVPELVKRYGIAPSTAQAAVEALRKEGLIVRRRGSGTYVAERAGSGVEGSTPPGGRPGTKADTLIVFAVASNAFFHNYVAMITLRAAERGLGVECRYADSRLMPEEVLAYASQGPAGFLVIGIKLEWVAEALWKGGHPVVLLNEPYVGETPAVPTVYSDAETGGYLATKRLLDLGHRRLLFAHPFGSEEELFRRRRWRGHQSALREAGLPEATPLVGPERTRQFAESPEALRSFLGAEDAPTAVIVWSDEQAVKLLGACQRAGVRVPGEVSILGYDNLPIGEHCHPRLDTVDQHIDVLVSHALSFLSLPVRGKVVSTSLVTPTLVCRESCAPPDRPR